MKLNMYICNYLQEYIWNDKEILDKKNYIKLDGDIYFIPPDEPMIYDHYIDKLIVHAYKLNLNRNNKPEVSFTSSIIVFYFVKTNTNNLINYNFTNLIKNKKISSVSIYEIKNRGYKSKILLGEGIYKEFEEKIDNLIDNLINVEKIEDEQETSSF